MNLTEVAERASAAGRDYAAERAGQSRRLLALGYREAEAFLREQHEVEYTCFVEAFLSAARAHFPDARREFVEREQQACAQLRRSHSPGGCWCDHCLKTCDHVRE